MALRKAQFGKNDIEILDKHTLFQGFFTMFRFQIKHKLFGGGWSETISRELLYRGDAAAAIMFDPVNNLVGLVEQFRVGALESSTGPWCLEVVAGMVEGDESPEALIRREIKEEAGLSDVRLMPITSYYSTPGGCSEKIHLFCGLCNLVGADGIFGLADESEDIRFHVLGADEVFKEMLSGRTNNAATLIGLQWLQMNREQLSYD